MQDHDLMNLALELEMEICEINKRAALEGWTFWTTPMPFDLWNRDYGYTSVREYEDHRVLATYSDLYKERTGVRPRFRITASEAAAEMQRWASQAKFAAARAKAEDDARADRALRIQQEIRNTQLADQLRPWKRGKAF